jgi:hypothetical protein
LSICCGDLRTILSSPKLIIPTLLSRSPCVPRHGCRSR